MKRILYFTLFLLISSATVLNAQVPISLSYDGNDVSNSEITLIRDVGMHVHLTNTGGSDMDVVVEVTDITTPHKAPEWQVCWGECFIVSGPTVIGTLNVPAGTTNTDDFHVTYISDGNTDPANITFNIYEDGIPGDFVSLIMDTEHVGINDIDINESISIFPNPANSYFNLKIDDSFKGSEMIITNIIGKIVMTADLEKTNNHISAGNLLSGVYFISIIKGKEIITTKKLIKN